MSTVAIIDYGSGNLHSAAKAFERAARDAELDVKIVLARHADDVAGADRIVLPGVGAFADCRAGLTSIDGMMDVLTQRVIVDARPFMGICVGMQLMATHGHEHGVTPGFDWIGGDVVEIVPDDPALKIPHMGWNTLEGSGASSHPVFDGIALGPNGDHAYFVHSYHLQPANTDHVLATTDYGGSLTAAVGRDTMIGTQFHPEKSQALGLRLITNFLRWAP